MDLDKAIYQSLTKNDMKNEPKNELAKDEKNKKVHEMDIRKKPETAPLDSGFDKMPKNEEPENMLKVSCFEAKSDVPPDSGLVKISEDSDKLVRIIR